MANASAIRGEVAAALSTRFAILDAAEAADDVALFIARRLGIAGSGLPDADGLVKLKFLSLEAARDPKKMGLFWFEAYAAAMLSHDNIVKTSKAERISNGYISVTEHRPGAETLRHLINCKGWLNITQAIGVACQVASALNYAHKLGVLHLGLEPEKILIEPEGTVFLTGFGIEAGNEFSWAHLERSRRLRVEYLSPEQAGGSKVDHRSDLYSLGVILFEMLTDRVPFASGDPEQVRRKHMTQMPIPLNILLADAPEPLSRIVANLLEKNPDKRLQSAARLQLELSRLLDSDLTVNWALGEATAVAPGGSHEPQKGEDKVDPQAVAATASGGGGSEQPWTLARPSHEVFTDIAHAEESLPAGVSDYDHLTHKGSGVVFEGAADESAPPELVIDAAEAGPTNSLGRAKIMRRGLFLSLLAVIIIGLIVLARAGYVPNIFFLSPVGKSGAHIKPEHASVNHVEGDIKRSEPGVEEIGVEIEMGAPRSDAGNEIFQHSPRVRFQRKRGVRLKRRAQTQTPTEIESAGPSRRGRRGSDPREAARWAIRGLQHSRW